MNPSSSPSTATADPSARVVELAAAAWSGPANEAGIDWASPEPREHDRIAAVAILATAQHRLRDRAGAAQTYREVLATKESLVGVHHPELVPTLNNLAVLLAEIGELDEAASIYADLMVARDTSIEAADVQLSVFRKVTPSQRVGWHSRSPSGPLPRPRSAFGLATATIRTMTFNGP